MADIKYGTECPQGCAEVLLFAYVGYKGRGRGGHEGFADGARLQGPNARNEIVGNEIGHTGGAGVVLVSLDQEGNSGSTPDFENQATLRRHSSRYPKLVRNVVSDNTIHHCGRIKKNCGGVQMYGINSVDNVISHNHIHDMSDKGMVMQDGFGRYVVDYNEMHDLGLEIADTGGIMVNRWFVLDDDPGLSRGAIIRFNRIRNCVGCGAYAEARHPKGEGDRTTAGGRIWTPYYTWGIYFDKGPATPTRCPTRAGRWIPPHPPPRIPWAPCRPNTTSSTG